MELKRFLCHTILLQLGYVVNVVAHPGAKTQDGATPAHAKPGGKKVEKAMKQLSQIMAANRPSYWNPWPRVFEDASDRFFATGERRTVKARSNGETYKPQNDPDYMALKANLTILLNLPVKIRSNLNHWKAEIVEGTLSIADAKAQATEVAKEIETEGIPIWDNLVDYIAKQELQYPPLSQLPPLPRSPRFTTDQINTLTRIIWNKILFPFWPDPTPPGSKYFTEQLQNVQNLREKIPSPRKNSKTWRSKNNINQANIALKALNSLQENIKKLAELNDEVEKHIKNIGDGKQTLDEVKAWAVGEKKTADELYKSWKKSTASVAEIQIGGKLLSASKIQRSNSVHSPPRHVLEAPKLRTSKSSTATENHWRQGKIIVIRHQPVGGYVFPFRGKKAI